MRVFRKIDRSLREAGRSLGKLREVYFKMNGVREFCQCPVFLKLISVFLKLLSFSI